MQEQEEIILENQQSVQLQLPSKRFSEIYLELGSFSVKKDEGKKQSRQAQQKSAIDQYFRSLPTDLFGLSFVFLEQQNIQGKETNSLTQLLDYYTYRCYFELLQNIQVDIMPGNFPDMINLRYLTKTMNLLKKVNNKVLWVRQEKLITQDECIELATLFFAQKNLKYALFYFAKMLSVEVYDRQLYIDIRENVYITPQNLINILQAVQKAFPSLYDIHIRIGDNNQLNSTIVETFTSLIKQHAQNLKRIKIFIGNRNYLGSKLFSQLGNVALPELKIFNLEVLSNNDQLSSDSQGLFDFLSKQINIRSLFIKYGSKNYLNAKSFENFGRSLQSLSKLNELEVSIGQWNQIQSDGCNNFTKSIKNLNLSRIQLTFDGYNNITAEGASKCFETLSQFVGLKSIKVGFGDKNCLDERCIFSFSNCIQKQIYLQTLSLNLVHKIDCDSSAIFQAIENKNSLSNLNLKIGAEYNIAGNAMKQLCQSLISLTQLKNLYVSFLGTANIPNSELQLLCMSIRKLPHLIGLQFYTDNIPKDQALTIFRYIFEGNVNFKDIRIGYDILFQYNYSRLELDIKDDKQWNREIVMSICKQISYYQPINDFIIRFNSDITKKKQPEDFITFLRYSCMSLQKNPNKIGQINICFEGFLEVFTQAVLLESYYLYGYQNQFLLNNKETTKFFVGEDKQINVYYKPRSQQNLTALQLDDIIQLLSGIGFDCINLKTSTTKSEQGGQNQQQQHGNQMMQMLGMNQQQQQQDEEDEDSDNDEDDNQDNGNQGGMQQNMHHPGQNQHGQQQQNFGRNSSLLMLQCCVNQLKNPKIKKFAVESMRSFYMRASESKFNFYLYETYRLPQHTLKQLSMNLIQKTTQFKEIELDLRIINNEGIKALRHLIDNQPHLVKFYLGGQIKLLRENVYDMTLLHFQLRSLDSLISLHLPIQYEGLMPNEIPDLTEQQQQEFQQFVLTSHANLVARIQEIQNPITQEEEAELQQIQEQVAHLRTEKREEYFKKSVDNFKIQIANTEKQVLKRQSLALMMKLSKLNLTRKLKRDIITDIGRSMFT